MKIPFGTRIIDSRMVSPSEVENGEGCGCICPDCGLPLIAKQGQINEWHFAHDRGADCAGGAESAIHKMAKQLIMERQQIYLPRRVLERTVSGPYDERRHEPIWHEVLAVEVQAEGLVNLTDCKEEQTLDTRRPDILAVVNDQQIAIEVAFSHFCDQEKLNWLRARGLTTLEIDISLQPNIALSEIHSALEARLFTASEHIEWLHHAGDQEALQVLHQASMQHLREHSQEDAIFEAEKAQRQERERRRNEFKAKVRAIDQTNISLSPDVTLVIAYSQIRCTLKGHGYFAGLPSGLKNLITDTGRRFGGRYNKDFHVWEFSLPEGQVENLYKRLIDYVSQRLFSELSKPLTKFPTPQPEPPMALTLGSYAFMDEDEREVFEERASSLEFDGGLSREDSERIAFDEILRRRLKNQLVG